jgi:hypothetical protein
VSELRGNETLIVGDPMVFAANVTNVGDAPTTGAVQLRIDLDDDDRPEYDGIFRNVTLAPGNETTVRFDVPYMEDPDPLNQVEDLPTGTYIYGIYTADGNQTGVFDARSRATTTNVFRGGGGGGSDGDEAGTGDGFERASLDEVAQAKYGYFYEEISGETQGQLEEIHARQPFAGDLGVTDVLTREEIARQEYGLDVEVGDDFEFSSIEIELQQQIEADFDAQFTSDTDDRVQSWEELARERFGQSFGNLTESQQEEVREHYREQFDS